MNKKLCLVFIVLLCSLLIPNNIFPQEKRYFSDETILDYFSQNHNKIKHSKGNTNAKGVCFEELEAVQQCSVVNIIFHGMQNSTIAIITSMNNLLDFERKSKLRIEPNVKYVLIVLVIDNVIIYLPRIELPFCQKV